MRKEWKNKPLPFIASVVSIVVSVAIIVLAVLQLSDVWSNAGYVYIPMMGINLLLQSYAQWNPNRKVAIINLCAAVLVLTCAVVVYIIK